MNVVNVTVVKMRKKFKNFVFQPEVYFQQLHCGTIVKDYLQETFPRQWIGRGAPIFDLYGHPTLHPKIFFPLRVCQRPGVCYKVSRYR